MQTLIDFAPSKKPTDGFEMLIARGLPELTGEAIVLRHAAHFPEKVVMAARARLESAGVDGAEASPVSDRTPGFLPSVFAGMDPASIALGDITPDIHGMARKLEGLLGVARMHRDHLSRRVRSGLVPSAPAGGQSSWATSLTVARSGPGT